MIAICSDNRDIIGVIARTQYVHEVFIDLFYNLLFSMNVASCIIDVIEWRS